MQSSDDISVSHQTGTADGQAIYQTVINDHKANRAWSGQSPISQDQASTEATRRMLQDRRIREYT